MNYSSHAPPRGHRAMRRTRAHAHAPARERATGLASVQKASGCGQMAHDIIAIGASAGGIEVLLQMVQQLPADLPASVFVVVHLTPNHPSLLPELLTRRGPLPAKHPLHGEKIVPGQIYVAPPDNHLMIRQGSMEVVRGPKE